MVASSQLAGPQSLHPLITRLRAPNPGPMTGSGTNSYIVGTANDLAVVDPGPADKGHVESLARITSGRLRWILVSHKHPDHEPGALLLQEMTDVPLLRHASRPGPSEGSPVVLPVADMEEVSGGASWSLQALHTPGHSSDHLCFLLRTSHERILLSGDMVMEGSTVVIPPPDGDMSHYLSSLRRLIALEPSLNAIAPGHGEMIGADPMGYLQHYLEHRLSREAAVLDVLRERGELTTAELVDEIYKGISPRLSRAAGLSLWAHLRKLVADGLVQADDVNDPDGSWRALPTENG